MAAPNEETSADLIKDVAAFQPKLPVIQAELYPDALQDSDEDDTLSAKVLSLPVEIRHKIFDNILSPSLERRAGLIITLADNSTYEILLIQCKGFCRGENRCDCGCPPNYDKSRFLRCRKVAVCKDNCTCFAPHHPESFYQSNIQRRVIDHRDVLQDPKKYFPQLSPGLLADLSVYLRQDAPNRVWSGCRKTELMRNTALLALATYLHYPGQTNHRKGRMPAQELVQSELNMQDAGQKVHKTGSKRGLEFVQYEPGSEPDYWVHMRVLIATPCPPLIRDSAKILMKATKQSEEWLERQRKMSRSKRIKKALRRGHAVPHESDQAVDDEGNHQWVEMASAARLFYNCNKRNVVAKEDKQLQSWIGQLVDPNSVTNWVRWRTQKHEKLGVDELKEMLGGAKVKLVGVHALSFPLPRITLTFPSSPEASAGGDRLAGRLECL